MSPEVQKFNMERVCMQEPLSTWGEVLSGVTA